METLPEQVVARSRLLSLTKPATGFWGFMLMSGSGIAAGTVVGLEFFGNPGVFLGLLGASLPLLAAFYHQGASRKHHARRFRSLVGAMEARGGIEGKRMAVLLRPFLPPEISSWRKGFSHGQETSPEWASDSFLDALEARLRDGVPLPPGLLRFAMPHPERCQRFLSTRSGPRADRFRLLLDRWTPLFSGSAGWPEEDIVPVAIAAKEAFQAYAEVGEDDDPWLDGVLDQLLQTLEGVVPPAQGRPSLPRREEAREMVRLALSDQA